MRQDTEYGRLRSAFVEVLGDAYLEKAPRPHDNRPPSQICRIRRNIWLHPQHPSRRDAQLVAWHGEGWVDTRRQAGLWFGLSMEFKVVFQHLIAAIRPEEFGELASVMMGFRVSFGRAWRSDSQYEPVRTGVAASEADYLSLFRGISDMMSHPGLPRPHLQIYASVGEWQGSGNTVDAIASRLSEARASLFPLIHRIVG